jgi:photosystem II stability/assembly factor-like uncharacterized protein
MKWRLVVLGLACASLAGMTEAQIYDLNGMEWRSVGPAIGGRSLTVGGSVKRPNEYYFGATGGGLWKTTNGGANWHPVTDGQIKSSPVGAVAVSQSNPDIVYIGMGESELRGSVIQGDGVYKTTDGGKTWSHLGLEHTQTISRIQIDPSDPDLVYVSALGHPYGDSEDRGIFRSKDGGKSWMKVLYKNDHAGAIDLAVDPHNPKVLFASIWDVYRRPWMLSSGGPSSGLYKSVDGGDTWQEVTRNPGMPKSLLGKINAAVSSADSNRIYALIEAEDGGLFRSDDGGDTWSMINDDHKLRQRAFYFNRITTDPKDPNVLYVMNVDLHKSMDGGKSFAVLHTSHPDHHDLWIAADDPNRMIAADDGGGNVSVDGGVSWTAENFSTAQLYHVETTKDIPYHICGTQQDQGSVCVRSDRFPDQHDPDEAAAPQTVYGVGGGEAGYIAEDPLHPDIFYAGTQAGVITRYDRRTEQIRDVQVNPLFFSGMAAKDLEERWQWVFPIVFSPVDSKILYTSSQHLWKSVNEGQSWTRMSPDLTRADVSTLRDSGGPITHDQNGPEIYGTIFAVAPSHFNAKTIWVGSDDGLAHVTQDGGAHWTDITPPQLPHFSRISMIEASTHKAASAYLVANRYELDDRKPYVFRTDDMGRTWKEILTGIAPDDFVRAVREDPKRSGLLYAGTEHGVYVSLNDGVQWQSLSLNLPDTQVPDLHVAGDDLVIATHGRSFYVLLDVSVLRQLTTDIARANFHLFKPAAQVRSLHPAYINYSLASAKSAVTITIRDRKGSVVQSFAVAKGKAQEKSTDSVPSNNRGINRFVWDGRCAGPVMFPGLILRGDNPRRGPAALPGVYRVELDVDGTRQTQLLSVRLDSRLTTVSRRDLAKQYSLATKTRDQLSTANRMVIQIREFKSQIDERISKIHDPNVVTAATTLEDKLAAIEQTLYQVRNNSPRDTLNYPIKLNNQLSHLMSAVEMGDVQPTNAMYTVSEVLTLRLEEQSRKLRAIEDWDIGQLNVMLTSEGLSMVTGERINLRHQ